MRGAGRPHQCGRLGSPHKALWRKELAAMEAKNALAVEGALVGLHRFPPNAKGAVRWVSHMSIHPRPNAYPDSCRFPIRLGAAGRFRMCRPRCHPFSGVACN